MDGLDRIGALFERLSNCAVIGFLDKPPTANLAEPAAHSQFPPR